MVWGVGDKGWHGVWEIKGGMGDKGWHGMWEIKGGMW